MTKSIEKTFEEFETNQNLELDQLAVAVENLNEDLLKDFLDGSIDDFSADTINYTSVVNVDPNKEKLKNFLFSTLDLEDSISQVLVDDFFTYLSENNYDFSSIDYELMYALTNKDDVKLKYLDH